MPVSDIGKVFYFTAKVKAEREEAQQLRRLTPDLGDYRQKSGSPHTGTAGDQLIALEPRAYDRLEKVLVSSGRQVVINTSTAQSLTRSDSYALCPFELNLEIARESDVAVFHYGFDPEFDCSVCLNSQRRNLCSG